jgi:hypothetical protein
MPVKARPLLADTLEVRGVSVSQADSADGALVVGRQIGVDHY